MRSEKIEVIGEGKNHSEYISGGLATVEMHCAEIRYSRLLCLTKGNERKPERIIAGVLHQRA